MQSDTVSGRAVDSNQITEAADKIAASTAQKTPQLNSNIFTLSSNSAGIIRSSWRIMGA